MCLTIENIAVMIQSSPEINSEFDSDIVSKIRYAQSKQIMDILLSVIWWKYTVHELGCSLT